VKYSLITQHENTYPVDLMCQLLGVKRQGYYAYFKRGKTRPDADHKERLDWVKEIARLTDNTYGSRRMKRALNALSYPVSRQKARKLMQEADVQVVRKRRFKKTTDSDHHLLVFDNLLKRDFDVEQPDCVYASDITYIWTQEGWLYLAVVIDLCSRKVVGWSMAPRMKGQLVCDALTMAVWNRRPEAGLIHHSDRGSQYASHAFRKLLNQHSIDGSMSRKGDCWDNAVVESFFGSLKQERVHRRSYQTRDEAQQDILNYITMFYNNIRLHSYLDYVSPNEYEKQLLALKKVA